MTDNAAEMRAAIFRFKKPLVCSDGRTAGGFGNGVHKLEIIFFQPLKHFVNRMTTFTRMTILILKPSRSLPCGRNAAEVRIEPIGGQAGPAIKSAASIVKLTTIRIV